MLCPIPSTVTSTTPSECYKVQELKCGQHWHCYSCHHEAHSMLCTLTFTVLILQHLHVQMPVLRLQQGQGRAGRQHVRHLIR